MGEEGQSASERIFQALREPAVELPDDWINSGYGLTDRDFLRELLQRHKALGFYEFRVRVGFSELTDEQNQEALDRLLASEIFNAAIDLAKEVARARKLIAEQEVAAKS